MEDDFNRDDGKHAVVLKKLVSLARVSARKGKAENAPLIIHGLHKVIRNREPSFNGFPLRPKLAEHHFRYPIDIEVLDALVEHGVLERGVFDTVLLCPECHGLPTIRPGCPSCGSSDLRRDDLIHHFSCGYVAPTSHFLQPDNSLRCRKCQRTHLIINSDYDVTSGACRCGECSWSGSHPKLVGRCSHCDLSFLISEAHQQDLWAYHAR